MRRQTETAGLQISVSVCSIALYSETEGRKAKQWSHFEKLYMNLIKAPLHKINVIIFKIIFLKKKTKKHTQLKYSTTVSFFESAGS